MARRVLLAAALVTTLVWPTFSGQAGAADAPYWPSDQQKRLDELEPQLQDVRSKLFAARMLQNNDEVSRLSKEYKKLRTEHFELLRATGQMPPAEK